MDLKIKGKYHKSSKPPPLPPPQTYFFQACVRGAYLRVGLI